MKKRKIKLKNALPKRSKVEKDLDKLASEICKKSAGNRCEVCRKKDMLNAHHIFTRTHRGTRWDQDNLICLCWAHHNHFAHGRDPEKFRDFVIDRLGKRKFETLKVKAYTTTKYSVKELLFLKQILKAELNELDN